MTGFVVDASAVLHLASAGAKVPGAYKLFAPTLVRSQALSALHETVQRGEIPAYVAQATRPPCTGPYLQWTRKVDGKTVTKLLTPEQLDRYQDWFDNDRKLKYLVAQLETLSIDTICKPPCHSYDCGHGHDPTSRHVYRSQG